MHELQLDLHFLLLTGLSSPISHLLSLLHKKLFLPVHSMPAPVGQLLYCTTVILKVLHCKIKNILFSVFLCISCMKNIIHLLQYYIADCVSCVPRLTVRFINILDLETCTSNRTHLYVRNLLYHYCQISLFSAYPSKWY